MSALGRLACIACMLLLSACGWHLKGTQANHEQLGSIYVTGDAINSVITKTVRADLRNSRVEVPDRRGDANYILWIGAEQTDRFKFGPLNRLSGKRTLRNGGDFSTGDRTAVARVVADENLVFECKWY